MKLKSILRASAGLVLVVGMVAASLTLHTPSASAATKNNCTSDRQYNWAKFPTVSYGDSGYCVKVMQWALNIARRHESYPTGWAQIAEDGKFGPATRTAVLKFQHSWPRLADTGVMDAKTWDALSSAY